MHKEIDIESLEQGAVLVKGDGSVRVWDTVVGHYEDVTREQLTEKECVVLGSLGKWHNAELLKWEHPEHETIVSGFLGHDKYNKVMEFYFEALDLYHNRVEVGGVRVPLRRTLLEALADAEAADLEL